MNNLNHRRMDVVREVSRDAFARAIALSVLGGKPPSVGDPYSSTGEETPATPTCSVI